MPLCATAVPQRCLRVGFLATIVIDASACDAAAFDVDVQFIVVDRTEAHMHIGEHFAARNP